MGSAAYDFLNQSLLVDESLVPDAYQGISDRELIGVLEAYRQHVLAHLPDFQAEANDLAGRVAVLRNRSSSGCPREHARRRETVSVRRLRREQNRRAEVR